VERWQGAARIKGRKTDLRCAGSARNTLAKLEQQLAPGNIVRTHRSYLVNIDKIDEIRATETGSHEILLASGKTVPLSRGYRDEFWSSFRD
jgi:DNA-binding LytR/AlgR family response regulator